MHITLWHTHELMDSSGHCRWPKKKQTRTNGKRNKKKILRIPCDATLNIIFFVVFESFHCGWFLSLPFLLRRAFSLPSISDVQRVCTVLNTYHLCARLLVFWVIIKWVFGLSCAVRARSLTVHLMLLMRPKQHQLQQTAPKTKKNKKWIRGSAAK